MIFPGWAVVRDSVQAGWDLRKIQMRPKRGGRGWGLHSPLAARENFV